MQEGLVHCDQPLVPDGQAPVGWWVLHGPRAAPTPTPSSIAISDSRIGPRERRGDAWSAPPARAAADDSARPAAPVDESTEREQAGAY
jgi:hypothetical protein